MKKIFTLIIPILFLAISSIRAQNTETCSTMQSEDELAYKDGEELVYAGNYTWGPIWTDVGEIVLSTRRIIGKPIRYYVKGEARTYKFYDTFFKVRDWYEASFEVPGMRPVHFYRNVNEGDYKMKNTYRFDWVNNLINITIQRKEAPARDTVLKVKPCTFDVLTFFYHARNLDFSNVRPNQVFPMIITIDDKVYSISYRFIKREAKKIKSIGKINCLKFSVEVIAGEVFKGNEKIEMWISDDKNHIPVFLETPIIVGKVRGRLKEYKNLKYPLNMAD